MGQGLETVALFSPPVISQSSLPLTWTYSKMFTAHADYKKIRKVVKWGTSFFDQGLSWRAATPIAKSG